MDSFCLSIAYSSPDLDSIHEAGHGLGGRKKDLKLNQQATMKTKQLAVLFLLIVSLSSCESREAKQQRLAREEQRRIELRQERIEQEKERARIAVERRLEERARLEREQKAREEREARERELQAIYDKYGDYSLRTGSTPYSYCYGGNKSCSDYGCSEIKVISPRNSDVLVSIKQNNRVVRHAYIRAGSSYKFELPNGSYQPFFYYGKGWYPEKEMKQASCGTLKGGFLYGESFGKDDPQYLSNNVLTYELILQTNGNFSTRPSSASEAL